MRRVSDLESNRVGVAMRIVKTAPIILALLSSYALASENIGYSYDVHGRLVAVAQSGGPNDNLQTSISHDTADNRTNYTVTGAASTIAIGDASVTEGGNLTFTVTRTGRPLQSATVDFATGDGTASSGADYVATSGTLTFAPGETSRTITVSTIDDASPEGNENLGVTLSSPSTGAELGRAVATGTIVDNDSVVALSISNAPTVTEGGTLAYTVTKSAPTNVSVSVNYATADGSGTAGSDYVPISGVLTFAPSEMTKMISVGTVDDGTPEPAKTVLVNLAGASSGAVIGSSQAMGTVNDNDTTPIVFSVSNAATVTEGGVLVFTVTKSGATYANTSVNYATANGSAAAGSDYNATSGTLTFGPSETSKAISVATIDDVTVEQAESVLVNLSSPVGGSIATGQGSGTVSDNDVDIPPVANTDNMGSVKACTSASYNVIANDTDPDGDYPLILAGIAEQSDGSMTVTMTNNTITINGYFVGAQYIKYIVRDARGAQSIGTLNVNIFRGPPSCTG